MTVVTRGPRTGVNTSLTTGQIATSVLLIYIALVSYSFSDPVVHIFSFRKLSLTPVFFVTSALIVSSTFS